MSEELSSDDILKEAKKFLAEDNKSMAIAKVLDSADLNNPEANFLAALFYFTGTGIQRNLSEANIYAEKYLQLEPNGRNSRNAKSIIDGSIGTENAKRLIFGSEEPYSPSHAVLQKNNNSNFKIILFIVGISVIVISFGAHYFYKNNYENNEITKNLISKHSNNAAQNKQNISELIDIKNIPEVVAPPATSGLLTQMLQNYDQPIKLIELKRDIENIYSKPEIGDIKQARSLNQQGLEAFGKKDYMESYKNFLEANKLNPADIEIANNIAYALIKLGEYRAAEKWLGLVLSVSPNRSSAWANLGEIYSETNRNNSAIAAFIITFNFSSNREKTIDYMKDVMLQPEYGENMKKNIANSLLILNTK